MSSNVSLQPNLGAEGVSVSETDALVATAVSVKSSEGQIYGYHIYNSNTAAMFVHLYDIPSASVTVGTSARKITVAVPPGGGVDGIFPIPIAFRTAITTAATTTITGNTAPGTGLLTNFFFA